MPSQSSWYLQGSIDIALESIRTYVDVAVAPVFVKKRLMEIFNIMTRRERERETCKAWYVM